MVLAHRYASISLPTIEVRSSQIEVSDKVSHILYESERKVHCPCGRGGTGGVTRKEIAECGDETRRCLPRGMWTGIHDESEP